MFTTPMFLLPPCADLEPVSFVLISSISPSSSGSRRACLLFGVMCYPHTMSSALIRVYLNSPSSALCEGLWKFCRSCCRASPSAYASAQTSITNSFSSLIIFQAGSAKNHSPRFERFRWLAPNCRHRSQPASGSSAMRIRQRISLKSFSKPPEILLSKSWPARSVKSK